MIQRHTETVRQTLVASADYDRLVESTRGGAALRATLPVTERANAALVAMRDEVLEDLYGELLEPA